MLEMAAWVVWRKVVSALCKKVPDARLTPTITTIYSYKKCFDIHIFMIMYERRFTNIYVIYNILYCESRQGPKYFY